MMMLSSGSTSIAWRTSRTVENTSKMSGMKISSNGTRCRHRHVAVKASIHDFTIKKLGSGTRAAPIEGAELNLSDYRGKVVLINNVATF